MNLLFIKDDKFIGEFDATKKVMIERYYIDHTPTRRTYVSKVFHKYKPAKAQLVIVHGFTSSSNFIEVNSGQSKLAVKLAANGIRVLLFDLYGFGYSGGIRNNGRIRYFVEDLHKVLLEAYTDVPVFLYGHSLGAAVIIHYLSLNKVPIAGVIFTSPMLVVPIYWRFSWAMNLVMRTFGTILDVEFS